MRTSLGIGAMLVAGTVHAQQDPTVEGEGPIILQRQRGPEQGLRLSPAALSLEVSASYQQGAVDAAGQKSTVSSWVFREIATVVTSGYYRHPNLFTFDLSLSGGLSEEFGDNSFGDSSEDIGTLYYWNFTGTILRVGDWPLTLYSRRQEDWIFRDFGGAIRSTSTVTGAAAEHHTANVDTLLDLSHSEVSQRGDQEFEDLDYTTDRFSWMSFARLDGRQTLDWRYEYTAVDESNGVDYSYSTHDADLTHEKELGTNGYDNLLSSLHYSMHESGDTAHRVRWSERLRLRHSEWFRTRYNYDFDYADTFGNQRTSHRGSAGFTHYVYKSLTTDGLLGGQYSESDGFDSTEWFTSLNSTYTKKAPYGLLTLYGGAGYSEVASDGAGEIQIIDQPGTFTDPLPIILTGRNIDPTTIIIRDPSGLLLIPGADYNVTTFPDRVEIARIVGGSIGSGESVLIDYVQDPLPESTIGTQTLNAGARYDFTDGLLNGLSPYARWARQDQNISSGDENAFVINEFTDTIYGVEYRFWDFTVGAERQEHDSTVLPYDATRYFARYVKRTDETTWSLNGTATNIQYPTEDNEIDFYTLSGSVTHQFSSRLYGDVTVLWRDESNRLAGDTRGFEQQMQLRWSYRQLDAYLRARASQLSTEDSDSHFEFIQIGFIRQF